MMARPTQKLCAVCGKPFAIENGRGKSRAKFCGELCRKEWNEAWRKAYQGSPKGKAAQKAFRASPKGKAAEQKRPCRKAYYNAYDKTPKGKAKKKRFRQSPKGRAYDVAYAEVWREEHPTYGADYRKENRESIAVKSAKYYEEHCEEKAVYGAKHYKENRERIAAKCAEYREKHHLAVKLMRIIGGPNCTKGVPSKVYESWKRKMSVYLCTRSLIGVICSISPSCQP
jgi:hypothetical protein